MKKRFDIIIPTFNGISRLPKLLSSIAAQNNHDYFCWVVDDCSTDDTVSMVKENFPWVRIIQMRKNFGPAHCRNMAIAKGHSPYIVFFDDDAYLDDPYWLNKASQLMGENKDFGQLATMIVSGFDKDILLDCGTRNDGFFIGTLWSTFYRKHKAYVSEKHMLSRRVLGASTAGTVIRRQVLEIIGGFDNKYYYPCEDTDLSLRIHLVGYDVFYEPSLVVYHLESQAMGERAKLKNYLYFRNSLFVLWENYPLRYAVNRTGKAVKFIIISIIWYWQQKFIRKDTVKFDGLASIYLKAMIGVLPFIPSLFIKRLKFRSKIKRPRAYLIDINQTFNEDVKRSMSIKTVIYSITNICNAKCDVCFQYKNLNQRNKKLLDINEIRKMFQSLKELEYVILGGGEPFLRSDIDQICHLLTRYNNNPTIAIPTNGSRPQIVYEKSKMILGFGCRELIISLSLDGMEEYHDRNRGIFGLFTAVKETYDQLQKLKKIFGDRLKIQINTCVTKNNIDQLDLLFDYLRNFMPDADWIFEPARGSFKHKKAVGLTIADWQILRQKLDVYRSKSSSNNFFELDKLLATGILTLKEKKQIMPCFGGSEFISVDCFGNVYPCEILESATNIRSLNYDFDRLLSNKKWNKTQEKIKNKCCYCTHFCWLTYSLRKQY